MKSTGIVRHLDELGRIVLPKELRKSMAIDAKDLLEIFTDGNRIASFGIYPVQVKDTTAAGDSFIGGLCTMLCEGKSIVDAVAYASAVSAITVSRNGAACSIPTAHEVDAFLENHASDCSVSLHF